jgi:Rhodopirellula transposase DDE domain
MVPYSPETAHCMKRFYESWSEKDRRRYAGIAALKYGHGGRHYIARVLGGSRRTVSKGAKAVSGRSRAETEKRIRRPGGGRKSYQETWSNIAEKFLQVLYDHTAGDPMDETVRWTDLGVTERVQLLRDHQEIPVSKSVVRQWLTKHNSRRRKAQKKHTMKRVPQRNEQCATLQRLKAEYEAAGKPIVSMDTKKKEPLGNFYRDGHLYTLEALKTYDPELGSCAAGVIIPHSFYDMRLNVGYLQLGTSHDPSAFACDSFRHGWYHYGRLHYPEATASLVLCDGGGSNSSRHHIFKHDLQSLADEIGVEIRMAHSPPYCSQDNPIEHRLFPHRTRACQGVIFTSIEVVKHLMQKTQTSRGWKVFVHIRDKLYQTGRKVADDFKHQMTIAHDSFLPQWNYRAVPSVSRNGKVI